MMLSGYACRLQERNVFGASWFPEGAMNWGRDLFWLWGVLSALWVAFMFGVFVWLLSLDAKWYLALMASVACAVVPPLIVYGIGRIVIWIGRGFRQSRT